MIVVLFLINIIQYQLLAQEYSHSFFVKLLEIMDYFLNLKIKIHGNIDNVKNKKLLVMCNHYDGIDLFAISKIFGYNKLYTIVKHDLVGSSDHKNLLSDIFYYFKNVFYYSGNFIPYKRGDKDDGVIIKEIIIDKITNGNNILIFPEGRGRIDGIPKDFKHGIFKLAVENKLNILPISIKYDKDAGSEMYEPIDLFKWFDLSADIYIHDIVSCENKDYLKLKDDVLKIITDVLVV